jgi:parallel beta-helix repeat protein
MIDHIRSFSPRGWSCLHLTEGAFDCYDAVITNKSVPLFPPPLPRFLFLPRFLTLTPSTLYCFSDIGPCGNSAYGNWADGISLSCKNTRVEFNTIVDPTDGGIVVFGAQGSQIINNTISVRNKTALGAMYVSYLLPPFSNPVFSPSRAD